MALLVILLHGIVLPVTGRSPGPSIQLEFLGRSISLPFDSSLQIPYNEPLTKEGLLEFCRKAEQSNYQPLLRSLLSVKQEEQLDDWLYYQLIRKTANSISPKAANYYRYTLYKWFLLTHSGYDATLKTDGQKLLFYVWSEETIYNIPYYQKDNKTYVCLNYHDYGSHINFEESPFREVVGSNDPASKLFSYRVTQLPDLGSCSYEEKDLVFNFYDQAYHFKVKLNPEIKTLFANYPVVDYAAYFNIPMSRETYQSLIPVLKDYIRDMPKHKGVDYLMRFTRYAFLFKPDTEHFGMEKRLSPEQTLLYGESDCEDRAALFFYLVKEIYNLPMIVLVYPQHVTLAVKFDKPVGHTVEYNGEKYSVCEPTPQKTDLQLGKMIPALKHQAFEVAYAYQPSK